MSTAVKRLYEGLFLVNSNAAASDWQGVINAVEKVLKRSDAEVVSLKKWDDRRLCYQIEGAERGTYILVYFNTDPLTIRAIERDVQLSEQILRVMILKTDKMSKEDMDRETPLDIAEKEEQAAQAESEPAAEITDTEGAAGKDVSDDDGQADKAEDTEDPKQE